MSAPARAAAAAELDGIADLTDPARLEPLLGPIAEIALEPLTTGGYSGAALQRVRVRLAHRKIHAQDCADCAAKEGLLDEITREIVLEGELSEDQRQKLLEIANRCPVHRTLTSEINIRTRARS